jgi:hypothetical protein
VHLRFHIERQSKSIGRDGLGADAYHGGSTELGLGGRMVSGKTERLEIVIACCGSAPSSRTAKARFGRGTS